MTQGSNKSFTCPHCKKRFQWTTNIADRKARCPSCNKRIRIPTVPERVAEAVDPLPEKPAAKPKPQDDTYELDLTGVDDETVDAPPTPAQQAAAETGRCPACNQSITSGAVICIKCGYNLKKGKRLKTQVRDEANPDAPTGDTVKLPQSALASIGEASPVTHALQDRTDDQASNRRQDLYLPLGLLGGGLLWRLLADLLLTDHGWAHMLERTSIEFLFVLPLMFLTSILIAMLFSTAFGTLTVTLIKLSAIIVAPELFGDLMEMWLGPFAWGFPGIFFVGPVYFGMYFGAFTVLFDLDADEAGAATSMMFVINFLLRWVLGVFGLPYVYYGYHWLHNWLFP